MNIVVVVVVVVVSKICCMNFVWIVVMFKLLV
jgi:hypothetical protein